MKTRSPTVSLSLKGQATKQVTVKWCIGGLRVVYVSTDEHYPNFETLKPKLTYSYSSEFLILRIFNNVVEINLHQ